jgi:hypothetical protein
MTTHLGQKLRYLQKTWFETTANLNYRRRKRNWKRRQKRLARPYSMPQAGLNLTYAFQLSMTATEKTKHKPSTLNVSG